jgi:hypothetical protein
MNLRAKRERIMALIVVGMFALWQGIVRYNSRRLVLQSEKRWVYREYDPRGKNVEIFRKRTEKEYFRVKGHLVNGVSMPGLAALDFSVTWLRILVSTYEEASVEGDFSWLFHKLRFISHFLPKDETSFQTALLPFFVVLGKDPAGALYLLNEKLSKFRTDWRISYWTGFHALENLHDRKMAGSLFLIAANYPGAPEYLVPLGVRLLQDEGEVNYLAMRNYAIKNLDPEAIEKLKRLRPEWFIVGETSGN